MDQLKSAWNGSLDAQKQAIYGQARALMEALLDPRCQQ